MGGNINTALHRQSHSRQTQHSRQPHYIHHLNWSGINLRVSKPQENVNFILKQIIHNKPPTFGQRSLWLAYDKNPLFRPSISGMPNCKHKKVQIKK